jgi:deazaflavin-dependent oxidoreductase (nitroreductase family)
MPADLVFTTLNRVHGAVLAVTRGRLGWRTPGMEVVQLHTIGRKSGQRRTVLLTAPLRIGNDFVVVASRGGDDEHPEWYRNLLAQPEVDVTTRDGDRPMTARVVQGDERSALWEQIVSHQRLYAFHQRRTPREIPVVVLSPR